MKANDCAGRHCVCTSLPPDPELEAEVKAILEQIERDEKRAAIVRTLIIAGACVLSFAIGAWTALASVAGAP